MSYSYSYTIKTEDFLPEWSVVEDTTFAAMGFRGHFRVEEPEFLLENCSQKQEEWQVTWCKHEREYRILPVYQITKGQYTGHVGRLLAKVPGRFVLLITEDGHRTYKPIKVRFNCAKADF